MTYNVFGETLSLTLSTVLLVLLKLIFSVGDELSQLWRFWRV